MPKETENWDGLGTMASYARDLRHATERAVWKARAEWEQEKAEAIAAAVASEREALRQDCEALLAEIPDGELDNDFDFGFCEAIGNVVDAIDARFRASGGNGEEESGD